MKIDLSHHAYCLEGNTDSIKEELFKVLEKEGDFKTKGNPDLWLGEFDKFGIDDARAINDFQNKKALGGKKKIITITANSLTREAQNSLLKTFEEPTPNTHFFIIIRTAEMLLPTLKSRLVIQKIAGLESDDTLAKNFLESPKNKRLEMVKEIAENKDRLEAIRLLDQLENIFYKKIKINKIEKEEENLIKTIYKFKGYLNDRSPSIKIILEHVALITPQ